MLIGLCGPICAGTTEVANYLVATHGFTTVRIARPVSYQVEAGASKLQITQRAGEAEEVVVAAAAATAGSQTVLEHVFPDATALLDFVTKRWQERFVTTDIWDEGVLDVIYKRPLFMLVSVDAPVLVRWKRYIQRWDQPTPPPSLEQFLETSDTHLYHPTLGIAPVLHRATLKLVNPTSNLSTLHSTLSSLDLPSEERLRPSWDTYFMTLSSLAARRSNCMKRRVGCVLVRSKRVISTGYNGTPRGMQNCVDGGCQRCNSAVEGALSTCLCIHAEENALLEAGRDRVGGGATLYCDTCPCLTCAIKIVQVGVVEVVYSEGYSMDTQTAAVLKEGGVNLRQYSPPRDGLAYLDGAFIGALGAIP